MVLDESLTYLSECMHIELKGVSSFSYSTIQYLQNIDQPDKYTVCHFTDIVHNCLWNIIHLIRLQGTECLWLLI